MYREFPPRPEPANWVTPVPHPKPGVFDTITNTWLSLSIESQIAITTAVIGIVVLGIFAIRKYLQKN